MTLPSCFSLIKTDFFANIVAEINNISASIPAGATNEELADIGAQLQSLIDSAYADISMLESNITSQLAFLGPIEALLEIPAANPTAIVTWITSFITDFLTPYIKPYLIYAEQLTAITAQVEAIAAAIEAAQLNLPGISITIPSITIGCTL